MARQKYLFIHQNFPGQFVHIVRELVRLGHEVVALGIKGHAVPGVQFGRYAPRSITYKTSTPMAAVLKPGCVALTVWQRDTLRTISAGAGILIATVDTHPWLRSRVLHWASDQFNNQQ